jgi:Uma2 family endonuclease
MSETQALLKEPKARIPKSKLLTYDDYVRLTPPDSGNYELHNGQIVYMATPIPPHQIFSGNLFTEINIHVRPNKLGRVIAAPMDTVFTPNDTLQPDILFISNEKLYLVGAKKIEGAPDFIVEILSPSNTPKEMRYKKSVYELSGVREYWVVNLDKKTLTQYENTNREFHVKRVFKQSDMLTSFVIQGFETAMSGLFE